MVAKLETVEKRLLLGHKNPMICHDDCCDENYVIWANRGFLGCKTPQVSILFLCNEALENDGALRNSLGRRDLSK